MRSQFPAVKCRRRLVKRLYIPLPDTKARRALIGNMLRGQPAKLSSADLARIVQATEGYSGSDIRALCREAAMVSIRFAVLSVITRQLHLPAEAG